MSTLRPYASLWRRTRTAVLAGSIALGSVLAPAATAVFDTGAIVRASDGTSGADSTFEWDGTSLEGATAIVSASPEGAELLAEPRRDATELSVIPNGTVVALRIAETDTVYDPDGVTRWWPVLYNGQAGWVSGYFLADAGGLAPGAIPYEFDGGSLEGAQARVRSAGGLNLRAEADASSGVLATIPDGTVVDLRIDETDTVYDPDGITRWWPVRYDGKDGWVSGYFLTSVAGTTTTTASASTTTTTTAAPPAPRTPFTWDGGELQGATAIAIGDGQGVNVRAEPSAGSAVALTIPDGTVVNLRIADLDTVVEPGTDTRWWPVEVNGVTGWISGMFLTSATSAPGLAPGNATDGVFPAGSTALVQTRSGEGAKLRAGAGMDAAEIGSVPERATVTVVSGPASNENSHNGWFEIDYNGQRGYIDGDLLVLIATPEAAPPAPAEAPQQPSQAPPQPTDGSAGPQATATQAPATGAEDDDDEEEQPTLQITPVTRPVDGTRNPTEPGAGPRVTPVPTQAQTPPAQSSTGFILPVEGAVRTQGFGCSSLGFYPYNPDWGCGVHDGVDYAAPAYTPIRAVAAGTVITSGWCDCGLGYYVEIDHGNNLHTIYGHMATQPPVRVGQQVTQGQEIGSVGSTGLSTGPHVHFMVQVNGISQDPDRYLP